MLQLTAFVESANKQEFTFLQPTVKCWFFSVATTPVCKTRVNAERIITNVACFDNVQQWLSFHYNLKGAPWGCQTEFASLTFPVCPALWLLALLSWQWCMASSWQWHVYVFIMMLFVDDYFNTGYLPIIIYELLTGDNIWNWFDWLFPVSLSMPLLYLYAFFLCVHWWWWLWSEHLLWP